MSACRKKGRKSIAWQLVVLVWLSVTALGAASMSVFLVNQGGIQIDAILSAPATAWWRVLLMLLLVDQAHLAWRRCIYLTLESVEAFDGIIRSVRWSLALRELDTWRLEK